MSLKESFWTGHQGHGDTLGVCAFTEETPADACTRDAGYTGCDAILEDMVNAPFCRKYNRPDAYEIYVELENGGSTTTQFNALFAGDPASGLSHSENANAFLLAPGARTV
jgi:hypothetical protein